MGTWTLRVSIIKHRRLLLPRPSLSTTTEEPVFPNPACPSHGFGFASRALRPNPKRSYALFQGILSQIIIANSYSRNPTFYVVLPGILSQIIIANSDYRNPTFYYVDT